MVAIQFVPLIAAILVASFAGAIAAAATTAACSPPYLEGKRYAINDWVSAPSSITASTATGDNRILCSPPGVDGCPSSGYTIVDSSTATPQLRYNYQCISLGTLCSNEKYAPGSTFTGMAWSMMGNNPCSDDQSGTKLNSYLRKNDGLGSYDTRHNLLSRRLQAKSSKTCKPTSAPSAKPSTAQPTGPTASPSQSPTTKATTQTPSVRPTTSATTPHPTKSKSGKSTRPPVTSLPTTAKPTNSRSLRCRSARSEQSVKVAGTGLMQPADVPSEITQAANATETLQTVNTTEILRHRPHLVPSKGIDQ